MGWNEGYRLLEETVIGVYNLGKLDKSMVAALFEPYRGTDIDSGGGGAMIPSLMMVKQWRKLFAKHGVFPCHHDLHLA